MRNSVDITTQSGATGCQSKHTVELCWRSFDELKGFDQTFVLYFRRMENGRVHFPFPYQPYNIQEQFMQALYKALDQGKVGIFESPTGTVGIYINR